MKNILPGFIHYLQIGSLLSLMVAGCASLPPRPDLPVEVAKRPAVSGQLAGLSAEFFSNNGSEKSGFRLITNGREALEARLALADMATSSIDLQYFIWQGDAAGVLLFDRLLKAADRGVKVRLLVDDIGIAASTRDLAALETHPNLEIRVFNPNPSRDYMIGGIFHFLASIKDLNRRMHNKLMIVDNHLSITGGRNIGNSYFGLGKKYNFVDIDVLSLGAVIKESSHAFDVYWNNNAAFPVSGWKVVLPPGSYNEMRNEIRYSLEKYRDQLTSYPLEPVDWQAWLLNFQQNIITGESHFLQDDPVKIDGLDYRLIDMIAYLADPTADEFLLASPYFIPEKTALDALRAGSEDGVNVKILTNSLASTNHTLVNSHYKKYRRPILETGAELYEFRHQPSIGLRAEADVEPVKAPFISLHAKVIVLDRRKCFIGSLNFDPRALVINSENGMLIDSPELSSMLADFLEEVMKPQNAYRLFLTKENKIEWRADDKILTGQPSRGLIQSLGDFFGAFLPIEDQL